MERLNKIIINPVFKENLNNIMEYESSRIYCGHGIEHLMDVARIAYIMALENKLAIQKDVIYAAALLHDIGKYIQYKSGIPHNVSSSELAPPILEQAGYSEEEIIQITGAIISHRVKGVEDYSLKDILYRADKLSRRCDFCRSKAICNWSEDKKNRGIMI